MKLCFLGTGGSWPSKKRNPMAIAVSSGPTTLLMDCGEGTQRQLLHSSISPMRIKGVLITHLHGDHVLGLPGLVQTMSLNGREEELMLVGPYGTAKAWEAAMSVCLFQSGFPTKVLELCPGEGATIGCLDIATCSAAHSVPSLAYRVSEMDRPGRFDTERAVELGIPEGRLWGDLQKGTSITFEKDGSKCTVSPEQVLGPKRKGASVVYSGDTAPSDSIIELSKGADLLIHEATFGDDHSGQAAEFGHSTAREAAVVAKRAGVRSLALVHLSPRYSKDDAHLMLLAQAREVMEDCSMPEDGETLEVTH